MAKTNSIDAPIADNPRGRNTKNNTTLVLVEKPGKRPYKARLVRRGKTNSRVRRALNNGDGDTFLVPTECITVVTDES